jgi:hypothetical protein
LPDVGVLTTADDVPPLLFKDLLDGEELLFVGVFVGVNRRRPLGASDWSEFSSETFSFFTPISSSIELLDFN